MAEHGHEVLDLILADVRTLRDDSKRHGETLARMEQRQDSLDITLRDIRSDSQCAADALLAADQRRAEALAAADAERARVLEKNHLRLAKLESEVAVGRGLRKHVLAIVLAVASSLATAWTAIKFGLGGDK